MLPGSSFATVSKPGGNIPVGACRFDADGDSVVGPDFSSPTAYTIGGWFKIHPNRDPGDYVSVFACERPEGHSTEWNQVYVAPGGIDLNFAHTGGDETIATGLSEDVWYFIMVTVGSSGAASFYFAEHGDSSVTKTTATISNLSAVEQVTIGASIFHQSEYYSGDLCLFRLWNAVLSDADVAAEYASPTHVRTSNILAVYNMETAATVFTDSSGNGNTATGLGFGSWSTVVGPTF